MRWMALIGVTVLILLAGCGKDQSFEPQEINPDIDACVVCNMSVAHTEYATQLILQDGTVHKFDDIGCMMDYIDNDGKSQEIAKKYVRDTETGEWIELEKAVFAYHPDYWTPMAFGVLSFKNEQAAESFIASQGTGELMTYEQLLDFDWEGHGHP